MTSPRRSASSTETKSPAAPEFQTPTTPASSSSPSPEPAETPKSYLFQESRQPSSPPPLEGEQPSMSPDEPQPSDPDAGSASGIRSMLAASAKAAKKRREELFPKICEAVEAGGEALNELLTADGSMERDQGLFLADENDVPDIADPIAGLISRRVPEGVGDPDVADLIALAIGVGAYVVKQWKKSRKLRRARRQLLAQAAVDHAPPEPEPGPVQTAPTTIPVGV